MSAIENSSWMTEDALAKRLGVDRGIVKKNRPHAPSGGVRIERGTIEWNGTAASWLAVQLRLPFVAEEKNAAGGPPASAAAAPSASAPSDVEELTVISKPVANGRHFPNPNLIKCRRTNGDEVYVRVLDSAKYQPMLADAQGPTDKPMTVQARKATAGNWWDVIGRAPRWPGRF